MRRFSLLLLLLMVSPSVAAEPTFTLPEGFAIQRVATQPMVRFPVVAAQDELGRLYVVDVAGPLDRAAVAAQKPLHRIVRLDDTNGDGVYDRATTFAENLPFPQGIMVFGGSIYVGCPPKIWKLTDTNSDGVADQREVWFDGKTLTGCANDLHGPYRGPDGYIYWTKGAFAEQTHTLFDGTTFKSRCAHVFRAKPDGSELEVMMTGGMDNPVGIAFSPSGELLVSNTFVQHPAGGKRDGLIHAVPGGIFGKDHDPIYAHPWTSPNLMPIMTHLGPAAPSGLLRYQSEAFGRNFKDNLFCAQFNLHKVSRHELVPSGSTYRTIDHDFLSSTHPDFHPTDVQEAADGSLIVIDTGGWYRLCCPSSQLVKDDAFGGIYRIRKTGATTKPRPNSWLVQEPKWTAPPNAMHARRRAAEKLGRSRDAAGVPTLIELLADDTNDAILDHTYTYALIRIADFTGTRAGLTHSSPRVRRACLVALDAMKANPLDTVPSWRDEAVRDAAILELSSKDATLKATAWWLAGKHPEWRVSIAQPLEAEWNSVRTDADREEFRRRVLGVIQNPVVREWIEILAFSPKRTDANFAMELMLAAKPNPTPKGWFEALKTQAILKNELALRTIRSLVPESPPNVDLMKMLAHLSSRTDYSASFRMEALLAIAPPPPMPANLWDDVLSLLKKPGPNRALAAEVCAKLKLTPPQLEQLAATLPEVGPIEMPLLLEVFKKSADEKVGQALIVALEAPTLRAAVRTEQLKPIFAKYPDTVKRDAEIIYKELDAARKNELARLDILVPEVKSGDPRRGHLIFNSAKAACATCHMIGYVGGKVGPDLTRIGSIRTERDLLEAVLYPSASFVRSYEPYTATTADGRSFMGTLKSDTDTGVTLELGPDKEIRIQRKDLEELKPSKVSIMPAGLDQQLSRQELLDLIAFLRTCK